MARSKAVKKRDRKPVAVVAGEDTIIHLVNLAAEAKTRLEEAQVAFDALKAQLIEAARPRRGQYDTVRLQAPEVEAVIAFGIDIALDQGAIPSVQEALGGQYRQYLERVVTFKARQALKDLLMAPRSGDPDVVRALKLAASLKERTPRVSFEAVPRATEPA